MSSRWKSFNVNRRMGKLLVPYIAAVVTVELILVLAEQLRWFS